MGLPQYVLQLLGPPRIRNAGGSPVDLAVGKPFALLVYLHLSPDAVSRDHLAQLFWSGSSRDRARGSVRHALWFLRKELGQDLFAQDDPVRLAEGAITSDLRQLLDHLAADRVEAAAAMWTGALPELADLADGIEWNHWVDEIRLDLEQQLAGALAARGHREWERGRPLEGVRWLREAVAIQPQRVQHHLDLVEALLDGRAFSEALSALNDARRLILGSDADDDLAELERRVDLLRRGAASDDPEDPTLQMEFTGREREFAALLRGWRQARDGDPCVGLITGEPGIGKTRLAQELGVVAQAEGGRVVHLKAEDSERPIEWGLLSEVIQGLLKLSGASGVSHASDGVLRTLVPSLSLADPGSDDPSVRAAAFLSRSRPSAALSDALADLMLAVAEDAPLLLVIDDLQWADTESRSVLARVATRIEGAPALLLFTCRSEVESPRVQKTLTLLAEGPRTIRVELAPWSESEVARVLRARVTFSGRGNEEALIQRIHRTTRGNPLFVVELLKAFQEEQIIAEGPDGEWIFRTNRLPPDLPLPESLRALVDRQLDQLSEEAKLVASHLARIGHPTSPRMLGARTGLGTSAVTNGIGELLQRRMVRWESPETLTFLHDELRAAVARRFQLHVGLTAGGGAQWSFFRTAVGASLALLLLSAAVYVFARPTPISPELFGGGTLVVTRGGDVEAYRFRVSEADGSYMAEAVNPAPHPPPSPGSPGPVRLVSGEMEWIPEGPLGLTPDGAHHLIHRPLEGGRHQLVLHNREAGDERSIYEGRRRPEQVDVSPLGQRVLFLLPGRIDALIVTTPGGRVLSRWTAEGIVRAHWCGPDHVLALIRGSDWVEAHIWNPVDDTLRPLDLDGLHLGGETACSPDGSTMILQGARAGRVDLYLHESSSGSLQRLELDAGVAPERVYWIPDEVPPLPAEIRIAGPDTVRLEWGEQALLEGELVFSDGTTRIDTLRWTSHDRDVAFVAASGHATAAGPGESWIVAEWNGWLRDSIRVEVSPSQGGKTLIRETFTDNALDKWIRPEAAGGWRVQPRQGVIRTAAGSDETHLLVSHGSEWLGEGGTVELEFRLPLTENQGQWIALCLVQETPDRRIDWDDLRARTLGDLRRAVYQSGCVRYPAGEFDQWDPRRIELHSHRSFPGAPIDVGEGLPRNEWVHLALSLGPDGAIAAFVDREWTGTSPVHLDQGGGGWHVAILGQALDTRLEIRELSLWPSLRYGAGSPE